MGEVPNPRTRYLIYAAPVLLLLGIGLAVGEIATTVGGLLMWSAPVVLVAGLIADAVALGRAGVQWTRVSRALYVLLAVWIPILTILYLLKRRSYRSQTTA
jgi:membrane-bound ClpP family serine protease